MPMHVQKGVVTGFDPLQGALWSLDVGGSLITVLCRMLALRVAATVVPEFGRAS